MCKTKKTELLFLALMLRSSRQGGRCAVIVPDGVLFGSSKAHKEIRERVGGRSQAGSRDRHAQRCVQALRRRQHGDPVLHQDQQGGTDHVWFYHMQADGLSPGRQARSGGEERHPRRAGAVEKRNPKKDTDRKAKAFFVPVEKFARTNTTCRSTATRRSFTRKSSTTRRW